MIKTQKSKVIEIKKLQRKAISLFNWSEKKVLKTKKSNKFSGLISLKVGKIYVFKITALGVKNVGIDEFSYGYSIFLPNTQLGDIVKAKIIKISNKKSKYGIARVIKKIKTKNTEKLNYNVGDTLEVNISKIGPKGVGIAELSDKYFLIIPEISCYAQKDQTVKVEITRIKTKYAFAKILNNSSKITKKKLTLSLKSDINFSKENNSIENQILRIKEGCKIQVLLPSKIKSFVQYLVLKINGVIFLVKPNLGAKPGDLVKIKCIKVLNLNNKLNLAFAKIIQIRPMSILKKRSLLQSNLRQMLQSGIHLGEKTIKCHARMKKYIWFRKKGPNKNKPLVQKGRHLINLLKTRRCLNKALIQLSKYALKGRTFLFVGTKKAAKRLIARISLFSKTSFFVNTRWLGGLLTNWKSILKSIKKIRPILKQKQTVLKKILKKRQNIKNRLMLNFFILKKRGKILIKKASLLLTKLKNLSPQLIDKSNDENTKKLFNEKIREKSLVLNLKRKQILTKGNFLLKRSQKLLQKNYAILKNSLILKDKANLIKNQYKNLLNELTINRKKLRELITLLIIGKQISKIQQSAKEQKNVLGLVSYKKLKNLTNISELNQSNQRLLIPNPPKDILNKMVLILKSQILVKTQNSISSVNPKNIIKSVFDFGSRYKETSINETKGNEKSQKILILSKLLNQFTIRLSFLEKSIQNQILKIKQQEQKLLSLKTTLNIIKLKIDYLNSFATKLQLELDKIKKLTKAEIPLIRLVRRKVKKIRAQKKLFKFLPNVNLLPTPRIKISETVEYLITNFVDPKLKYPIERIYDEEVKNMSKKVAASRKKRWQRLEKYFGGIAKMTKMKKQHVSNNVAIIIGQKDEINAIRECQKLGIKTFQILDTNCNPNLADHFVPANDDSRNALEYLLKAFLMHIRLAQKLRLQLKTQKKFKIVRAKINKNSNKVANKKKLNKK